MSNCESAKVSNCACLKVSNCECLKVSKCQSMNYECVKVSNCVKVRNCQTVKVLKCSKMMMTMSLSDLVTTLGVRSVSLPIMTRKIACEIGTVKSIAIQTHSNFQHSEHWQHCHTNSHCSLFNNEFQCPQ